jgi:hypothetical protein
MLAAYRESETQKSQQRHEMLKLRRHTITTAIQPPIQSAMDLQQAVMRAIRERTRGGVQSLQVHILGGRVVLRGWAGSYHAVQLALAGLFEAFRAMNLDRPEEVELDIDVLCNDAPS